MPAYSDCTSLSVAMRDLGDIYYNLSILILFSYGDDMVLILSSVAIIYEMSCFTGLCTSKVASPSFFILRILKYL